MNTAADRPKRAYRMAARATGVARTRERILDAAIAFAGERFVEDISLADIAAAAGVTVQTVLRHFDGRSSLLAAAALRGEQAVEGPRRQVTPGDVDEAARRAVADYERFGDALMLWLAQEERSSFIRPLAERGRALHHAWIDAVFARELSGRHGADRARLRAQLIAVTDVYTWKLLRRDVRLGRRETERAIAGLIRGALDDTEER
jgi:AcrR family transcriptional regulator